MAPDRPVPLHMDQPNTSKSAPPLLTLLAVVTAVAVLYLADDVLIPLALAILLSFLLAPLVIRLQHWGLGRVPSVIVVTMLSFSVIGLLGWIVAGQVIDLASQLPQYKDNIRQKIEALRIPSDGVLGRATQGIREIEQEVAEAAATQAEDTATQVSPAATAAPRQQPVPVRVTQEPPNPLEAIGAAITPFLGPLASAGIVIIFVIFMLIQREDLRDRIIRLIGQGRLTVTTKAIDDAAQRVSRYLLALLIVNTTYGAAVGVSLYFIGLPNAILWGVLAALLRFIPYVGPWIGAALPTLLSLAIFDGWTRPLITAGMFIVVELLSNNVMEPLLYGSKTGLTPVAILLSAVFWAWLWGPVGLVLATPLTVCLVVIGRYVPQLGFLSVLLSDEPSLPPEARVYGRLLAMDQDEVYELAADYLKDRSLLDLYQNVMIPALTLAERDRHYGRLEAHRAQIVYSGMRDVIETLGEQRRRAALEGNGQASKNGAPAPRPLVARNGLVICLPARDEADDLAAVMLAQLLEDEGTPADALSVQSLAGEMIEEVERRHPHAVYISALPPFAVMHSRYLCKRLLARFGDLKLVVGLWNVPDMARARERMEACGSGHVVRTLAEALDLARR